MMLPLARKDRQFRVYCSTVVTKMLQRPIERGDGERRRFSGHVGVENWRRVEEGSCCECDGNSPFK